MKRILRTTILLLVRILGAPGAFMATRQTRRRGIPHKREFKGTKSVQHGDGDRKGGDGTRPTSTQRHHSPRILLVRPDHLGDMLLVTPILQALKERVPNAHITMM